MEAKEIRKQQILLDPYPSADREINMIKAGIREAMKEYNTIIACTYMSGYHYLTDCKECEQAKLKERS